MMNHHSSSQELHNLDAERIQALARKVTFSTARAGLRISSQANRGPVKHLTRPLVGSTKFLIGWSLLYVAGIHHLMNANYEP